MPLVLDAGKRDRYVYAVYVGQQKLPCYIGAGKGNRWKQHLIEARREDRTKLTGKRHRILRACWVRGIPIVIKKVACCLTIDEACQLEKKLIDGYGRRDLGSGPLLNATKGGRGVKTLAPSTLKRLADAGRRHMARPEIREILNARIRTPEVRARVSAAGKGRKASPEARAKMSADRRRRFEQNPDQLVKFLSYRVPGGNLGHKQSSAAKIKISNALKAQWKDPELRERRSAAFKNLSPEAKAKVEASRFGRQTMLGKKHSPETRAKMSFAHKRRKSDGCVGVGSR